MASPNTIASVDGASHDQEVPQLTELMSFRKRGEEQITPVEKQHMKGLPKVLFFLHHPPYFHANRDDCGEEIHAGLVSKWSTFLIVETLLAGLTIQPLVAPVSINGWTYDVYGIVWALAFVGSTFGLFVNGVLLCYLIHCPRKLAWVWMCKVGIVSELPIVVLWTSSLLSLLATGYTIWALYGLRLVVIPSAITALASLAVIVWLMRRLKKKLLETFEVG